MRDSAGLMEIMMKQPLSGSEAKRYAGGFIDMDAVNYNNKMLEVIPVEDDFENLMEDFDEVIGNLSAEAGFTGCKIKEEVGLPVPDDPELTWLTHFVDGSSSIEDETPKFDDAFKNTRLDEFSSILVCDEEGSPASGLESSSTSGQQAWKEQFPDLSTLPGRARSKRSRTGTPNRKVWSADILDNKNNANDGYKSPCSSNDNDDDDEEYHDVDEDEGDISSMFDDTSTTTTTRYHHCPSTSFTAESNLRRMAPPPRKKAKGKKRQDAGVVTTVITTSVPVYHQDVTNVVSQSQEQVQKCLHCGSQKTPQWRTGPLGAKTLCNACGVRFKAGKLFPEYRPAASPTFVPQKHSNSHKRVLEMRKQKENVVVEFIPRAQDEDDDDQPHRRQHHHLQRVPRRREQQQVKQVIKQEINNNNNNNDKTNNYEMLTTYADEPAED